MSVDDHFDDETVYSDGESFESDDDSVVSVEGLYTRREFRVRRQDGHKPVYEAYRLRLPLDLEECEQDTKTWSFHGVTIASNTSTHMPTLKFDLLPVEGQQSELADMHLRALEQFQAKHRRGWTSRVLRGKPKTYEQRLDERCRRLPPTVQEQLYELLDERDEMSSTKYHARKWKIVVMEEQERFRFAETDMAQVKRHKLRFWKNKTVAELPMLNFFIVIQGSERKACEDPKGFAEFNRHGNPWVHIDREESRRQARESRRRRNEEFRKRSSSPSFYPTWRSRSPMSESEPVRMRYREPERRHRSPPSYRTQHDYSPMSEPENETQARRYIRATRNAPPMVPMAPMFGPICIPPGPPLPPGFGRSMAGPGSRMPPPPPPPMPRYPSPELNYSHSHFAPGRLPPTPPLPPWDDEPASFHESFLSTPPPPPAPRPIVSVDVPQAFGHRPQHLGYYDDGLPWSLSCVPPRPRSECIGCPETRDCEHFGGDICARALRVQTAQGTSQYSHPPCFICMAKASDPRPLMGPPFSSNRVHEQTLPSPPPPPMSSVDNDMYNEYAVFMAESVELAGSPPLGPPPYPHCNEPWRDRVFDDGDATTDIECDDESDDGEVTAVADSPRPKEDM